MKECFICEDPADDGLYCRECAEMMRNLDKCVECGCHLLDYSGICDSRYEELVPSQFRLPTGCVEMACSKCERPSHMCECIVSCPGCKAEDGQTCGCGCPF